MRVLFIKPPNWGLFHEIERFIPIGIAYLASACRQAGHTVAIFDSLAFTEDNRVLNYYELSEIQKKKVKSHPAWRYIIQWGAGWERIRKNIKEFQPDIICITAMHSPMYDSAYMTAAVAREVSPGAIIIMGGSHATIAYRHVLDQPDIDYVLLGEGEQSLPHLLQYLDDKTKPYVVDGIVFRENEQSCTNIKTYNGIPLYLKPKTEWINNLDSISFPAVDLLDFKRYGQRTVLITSRGCPFSCSFCTVHPTVGKVYRYRSPVGVVNEIEWYIKNYNIRKFNIEDDNFTYMIKRAEEICDMIIERNLNIEFTLPNGIMALNMNERIVEKMVKAGIKDLFIGLETTSQDKLNQMAKGFTSLSKVKKVLSWFNKRGLKMGVSLIIGLPDQTLTEMINDIVTLIKEDIHFGTANPFYPIPGSRLYTICVEKGLITSDMDYTWFCEFNFPIETDQFSRKDLYELWIACLAVTPWNGILKSISKKCQSVEILAKLMDSEKGAGKIIIGDEGFRYIPGKGMSFFEQMKLTTRPADSFKYIDILTEDMIASLSYMFTGEPYTATQVKSIFAGDTHNEFWVKKDISKKSHTMEMLINALHEI